MILEFWGGGGGGGGAGGHTGCHENRAHDHQFLISAPEDRQQPQDDDSTKQNRESNWNPTNSYTDWIVSVNIEGLGWPEHDNTEEIGPRDKGDNERQGENSRRLL